MALPLRHTNCLPHWADSAEPIWSSPAVASISVRQPSVLTSAVGQNAAADVWLS